jgi:hypothetical protein
MKKLTFLLSLFISFYSKAQDAPEFYYKYIAIADSLYSLKEYKTATGFYSEAFKSYGWKGYENDRYNAACTWALEGNSDSAFYQLERIATKKNYSNYNHITKDIDLVSLYKDSRWKPLIDLIKQNKEKEEIGMNIPIKELLEKIYDDDQEDRLKLIEKEKILGSKSKEIEDLWKIIIEKDSINLVKIKSILDVYGWVGSDKVGSKANQTLFLVIQHSDQATQEKYLPMMKQAVKSGRADGSELAMLEDRVALGQNKHQVYGSQIGTDEKTSLHILLPVIDPDNLDKRRAEVGLGPISDYLKNWNITWNLEQYKKNLPAMVEKYFNKK